MFQNIFRKLCDLVRRNPLIKLLRSWSRKERKSYLLWVSIGFLVTCAAIFPLSPSNFLPLFNNPFSHRGLKALSTIGSIGFFGASLVSGVRLGAGMREQDGRLHEISHSAPHALPRMFNFFPFGLLLVYMLGFITIIPVYLYNIIRLLQPVRSHEDPWD